MRQDFSSIFFAMALMGAILFSSHFTTNIDNQNALPAPVAQEKGDAQITPTHIPLVAKLPDLFPAVSSTPTPLAAENNPRFYPIRNWDFSAIELKARSALATDLSLGRILYQKDIDTPRPIASLTKLMTALIVLENLKPGDILTVPEEAAKTEGSQGKLPVGEQFSVESLLKIMLIESSNDAAVAFASSIGTEKFIELMNKKAKDLGLENTRFSDPAGLDDAGNISTVSDIAVLAKHIFTVRPEIAEMTRTYSAVITSADGKTTYEVKNSNKLLETRPEILAGKTGFTGVAGECLVLMVQLSDENKIITIVLGSPDRFGESEKLIDWLKLAYIWK